MAFGIQKCPLMTQRCGPAAHAAKIWSAIPDETAAQTHFYPGAKADGTMDTRFEKFVSEVEGRAAPAYENILKGVIPKDGHARRDFSQFLALMHVCTPAMRRVTAEVLGHRVQTIRDEDAP